MKTINKFDFNNNKAIVRVDFNVPIEQDKVTDNSRILAAKTTIDKIAEIQTNKLVVISEKYFVMNLPKYPNKDPINGKNIIAYSI